MNNQTNLSPGQSSHTAPGPETSLSPPAKTGGLPKGGVLIEIEDIIIDDSLQTRLNDPGSDDVIDGYTASLLNGDSFPPITVIDVPGEGLVLVDGFHRVSAAMMADRSVIHALIIPGTRRDAVLAAVGSNHTHGLRRTRASKRRAVSMLLSDPEWAKWSDREIARRAAVTAPTVAAIRTELGQERTSRTYTRNGQQQVMQVKTSTPPLKVVPPPLPTKLPPPSAASSAPLGDGEDPYGEANIDTRDPAKTRGVGSDVSEANIDTRDPDAWMTPSWTIALAREVMGEISLDPASSDLAQKTVKADTYYTEQNSGLDADWSGQRVWLNAPFSKMGAFTDKLLATFGLKATKAKHDRYTLEPCGDVPAPGTEAIVVVNSNTASGWYQKLAVASDAMCMPARRLEFAENIAGKRVKGPRPQHNQTILYFGEQPEVFTTTFAARGVCFMSGDV